MQLKDSKMAVGREEIGSSRKIPIGKQRVGKLKREIEWAEKNPPIVVCLTIAMLAILKKRRSGR